MWNALLSVMIVAQSTTGAGARQTVEPSPLRLVVASPVYQPDGNVSIETAAVSNGPAVIHLYGRRSICDTGAAGAAEPSDAGFGWRLTLNTVRADNAVMVVSVDWQRVWDRGQRLQNGPSGTVQLTLHLGDRIPLDLIPNAAASESCRAVAMGLEVTIGRTTTPEQTNSALLPLGAVEGGASALNADLWLVHRLPSGVEQAHHQTVRLPPGGAPFTFAPVTLTTARGDVSVMVSGSFRRYRAATGVEFLYVSMVRSVTGGATPPGGLRGGTTTVIPQPDPMEVISLEMTAPGERAVGMAPRMGVPRGGGGGTRGGGGGVVETPVVRGPSVPAEPPGSQRGVALPQAKATVQGGLSTFGVLEGHAFSLRMRLTPAPPAPAIPGM
jgi:hypothetical protein